MSNTKALIKYVRDRLNDGPNLTFGKPTVYDLVEALESAEANVVRLTKMIDWLAEKQIRCAANGEQWYGPTIGKELHVPMYPSKTEAINALVEATSRAVAEGEKICQK